MINFTPLLYNVLFLLKYRQKALHQLAHDL